MLVHQIEIQARNLLYIVDVGFLKGIQFLPVVEVWIYPWKHLFYFDPWIEESEVWTEDKHLF
jgi:hypothetical protein